MAEKQLLHIVIGGELAKLGDKKFRDLKKVEFVGAYPSYEAAAKAWRTASQSTVDNALMRYFILHAHRLLDPDSADDEHEH